MGRDVSDDDRVVFLDLFHNGIHSRVQPDGLTDLIAVLSGIQFGNKMLRADITIYEKHLMRRIELRVKMPRKQCPGDCQDCLRDDQIDHMLQVGSEAPFTQQCQLQIRDGVLEEDGQRLSVQGIHVAQISDLESAEYL